MPLHLTKVAFGCRTIEALEKRIAARTRDGEVRVATRMRPKRADELIGGSIFWIIKHRIVARQSILGFAEASDRRTIIRLDPDLVFVRAAPKRAHQGWRYLADDDVPAETGDGLADLPPRLYIKLSALALV